MTGERRGAKSGYPQNCLSGVTKILSSSFWPASPRVTMSGSFRTVCKLDFAHFPAEAREISELPQPSGAA
jgi:hypothetical protein